MGKALDLTGQRFGRLIVIERDFSKKGVYWICQCECGNIKSIASRHLRSGATLSCGCLQRQRTHEKNLIDLTNQKFGRWTVIDRDYTKKDTAWICQCECGNIKSVNSKNLREGKSTSCGCLAKEKTSQRLLKDLTGQKFGELVVLEQDLRKSKTSWICECSCGNKVSVLSSNLTSGRSRSCGCFRKSHGENQILKSLKEIKCIYKREFSFDDLQGTKGPLRFDFAIFKNDKIVCLIEYQGEQHYKPSDLFGGKEEFLKRQEYDNKKRKYCRDNNIKLIEIPYWDLNKISSQYLIELGVN